MGLPEERVDLDKAMYNAVLELDVGILEDGLNTMVGPKGVRLSGGQVQRSAAARMFVRNPELLVLDDLSSALDVDTEKELRARVFTLKESDETTCLVVSHRKTALQKADHVIVMADGKKHDEGTLESLLDRCVEMQKLWKELTQ